MESESEMTELARKVNEQKQIIAELTSHIEKLEQEKERSKTLVDIQVNVFKKFETIVFFFCLTADCLALDPCWTVLLPWSLFNT